MSPNTLPPVTGRDLTGGSPLCLARSIMLPAVRACINPPILPSRSGDASTVKTLLGCRDKHRCDARCDRSCSIVPAPLALASAPLRAAGSSGRHGSHNSLMEPWTKAARRFFTNAAPPLAIGIMVHLYHIATGCDWHCSSSKRESRASCLDEFTASSQRHQTQGPASESEPPDSARAPDCDKSASGISLVPSCHCQLRVMSVPV